MDKLKVYKLAFSIIIEDVIEIENINIIVKTDMDRSIVLADKVLSIAKDYFKSFISLFPNKNVITKIEFADPVKFKEFLEMKKNYTLFYNDDQAFMTEDLKYHAIEVFIDNNSATIQKYESLIDNTTTSNSRVVKHYRVDLDLTGIYLFERRSHILIKGLNIYIDTSLKEEMDIKWAIRDSLVKYMINDILNPKTCIDRSSYIFYMEKDNAEELIFGDVANRIFDDEFDHMRIVELETITSKKVIDHLFDHSRKTFYIQEYEEGFNYKPKLIWNGKNYEDNKSDETFYTRIVGNNSNLSIEVSFEQE